jgi:hypothetical protein
MSEQVENHKAAVQLLEAGADVGKGNKVFESIRHCQCTCYHPIVMRWCKDNGVRRARAAYCLDDDRAEGNRDMFEACEQGHFDKLSTRGGCYLARDEYGYTLLMRNLGSWRSLCHVASYAGFDVNCHPDNKGRTVLHYAVLGGSRKVLREVLKAGADAWAVDQEGQTALMALQLRRRWFTEEDVYDGVDDSDGECRPHWGADPLRVDYREDDGLIDMLVKYVCAQEAARRAGGSSRQPS